MASASGQVLRRFIRFNAVGVVGAGVQLSLLWALANALRVPYVLATMMAVEGALLHNFAWHEAWTWRGLPADGWRARLVRFHVANGFVSIASNTVFTFAFKQWAHLPLLAANLAAIVLTALLNFALANAWVFRLPRPAARLAGVQEGETARVKRMTMLLLVSMLVTAPLTAAVFTTKLQNNTVAAWKEYVAEREPGIAGRAMLDVHGEKPLLVDLNPNGDNHGKQVPSGYVHHWIAAMLVPNTTVEAVRGVLEDYPHYPQIYAPEVKIASASRLDGETGDDSYDVRLVTEKVDVLGLHFAHDIRSRVEYRRVGEYTTIVSRSYSIRESNSGRAPYKDLLPEGNDHGILWRLNSYWRLRQVGTSVYIECQVISLSRRPPLGAGDTVKSRAKNSLQATMVKTRAGCSRQKP